MPETAQGMALSPAAAEVMLVDAAVLPAAGLWRRMRSDRSAVVGLALASFLLILALLGPVLVPQDPLAIHPDDILAGPGSGHLFGTDNLGRDILSRVVAGSRASVSIALLTAGCILATGTVIGAVAGFAGRWVDSVAMRVVDVFLAFPTLVLALAIAGTLGGGFGSLVLALVATGWPAYARLVRGGVISEREREYVDAARGLGARPRRLLAGHILPNALSPVLVLLSFDLGTIILFVAALGYLGVGIPPPTPEWGTMVSDGRNFVFSSPEMILFPGLAIAIAVVGFNLLGDGLRNALDPRHLPARGRLTWGRRSSGAGAGGRATSERPAVSGARDARPSGRPALLKVERLEVRIEVGDAAVHAVNGVTFSVEAGETVGLVGESGCGKTVTALSIMGLLPPGGRIVTGHVELSGQAVTGAGEGSLRQLRGRAVGMVFQDPMSSLNPTMTIGDQIARPLRHHLGITRHQARARAAEALALVGLPKPAERVDDYPHQLSGGQRQRVMIAMAVACGPKLLIADEPTTALDVTIQAQILELLDDLKASLGMGLLLITHDLGVIARTADRVMVMYAGRIVESASTASVFHRMSHPYTEALLQSLPQVAQPGATLASIPGLPPDLRHPVGGCSFAPRCRYATPGCADLVPPLVEKVPGHRYACYHPVGPSGDRRSATTGVLVGRGPRAPTAPAPAAEPLVEVDRVVKELPLRWAGGAPGTRSVKAVSGVSLSVGRGETFALVGESGCGKTTLGRMLVALEAPDSGRVVFSGQDLADLAPRQLRQRRQQFQLMFQDPASSLDPRVKVGAALREPLAIHQVGSEAERRARVSELLAEVGLDDQAEGLYPHQFSGGQRQRIALARALALRPSLVVADEPVSALDVSIRSQILNLMRRLQADHALTYVLISHDLGVVRNLADRTGVMYLGKLVETGPTEDVYRQPAHPYTAALLAAVPVADPTLERARPRLAIRGELPSAVDPPTGCRYRTRCPLAQEVCAAVEPPMRPFDTAAHLAACHFPLRPPPGAGGSQRAEPTRREEQSLDPT